MMFNSLETRLQIGLTVTLAVLIAGAWWLGHIALHRSTEAQTLSRLQHDAEALLGELSLSITPGGAPTADGMMPTYHQPQSGYYFKVLGLGEPIRSRSLWDSDLDIRPLTVGEQANWRAAGPDQQQLLVRSAGYWLGDREITVAVAEDMAPLESVLQEFELLFAVLACVGLGLAFLTQRFLVRHTFARLGPVYRDIQGLEHGTRQRITEDVPREILPLVKKLNGVLEVYDKRLQRSRNAAGNLAHALKTPLNLIMQQLGQGQGNLGPADRGLCRDQVLRIRQLVEHELKRARIAGGGTPGSLFDPGAELPVLKDVVLRLYPDKRLELDCRIELHRPLAADREDMLELLGSLLDNACKWANRRVRCRLEPHSDDIVFTVEDDGPGCSEAERDELGTRGLRLDERVAGHGLGLSIVREIVDLYHGRISFGRSRELQGLEVQVFLPLRVNENEND